MPYAYGSVEGVQRLVRHAPAGGTNQPTTADYEAWLEARSAKLTAWLVDAGYIVPVTQTEAKAILDDYANKGGACDAESAIRMIGLTSDDENSRFTLFCDQFSSAEAWIQSGALAALGVPQQIVGDLAKQQPAIGTIVAGSIADPVRRRQPPEWNV